MSNRSTRVCPVELAGSLDTRFRRWFQKPKKILAPYIKEGMTVLDFGCGPGYFTIPMAEMVGSSGYVIAADLQEGMLHKLKEKIEGTSIADRITLHKCEVNQIGVSENVDFILAFYVIHEVPEKEKLFEEFATILNPDGKLFIVEPPFHVSKKALAETISKAEAAGFTEVERPGIPFNKTVVLKKK